MGGRLTILVLLAGLSLFMAGAARAESAPVAAATDAAAMQKTVGPAVCCLSVENKWGVPTALATGFLLGDGRFAVTDLGVVAQPGVAQVSLRFSDGTAAVARQFGMADTGLGLVALRLEENAPQRAGLPLAPSLPATDGTVTVATAGWRWGKRLDVMTGRLLKGPAIKDLAARARVETPAGVDAFVRMDGGRLEGATGSPLLDSAGTVIGVRLEVVCRDATAALAIPASTLRAALLSSQPQLKPLSELPTPLWPTRFLRLPGEPAAPAEFSRAIQQVKAAMVCPACGGKGKVEIMDAPFGGGRGGRGGGGRGAGRIPGGGPGTGGRGDSHRTCPTCMGEKYAVQDTFLPALAEVALMGTRIVWVPTTDDRARAAARADGANLLKVLTGVGPHFDKTFGDAVAAGLARPDTRLPRGIVLRAEVREHREGPDGTYLILAPWRAATLIGVRAEDLVPPTGKAGARDRKIPLDGTWIVVAGAVLSRLDTGTDQGLAVLPWEWMATSTPPPVQPAAPGGEAAKQ